MTDIDAFPFGSATAQGLAIQQRRISAVELLQAYLQRVDRFNPALNAIVVDDRERALARAKEADAALARGEHWGPLHGVPMTVKESFQLEGHPTTFGFAPMKNNIAAQDALAVQRLKRAGAVVFGKTNLPLFLGDFQSYNSVYGTTNNPWDLSRTPGGSSGGSAAALAAGLTALEYGSDIGGSIRNPAAYSGVYCHKTSWGLVPRRGHALQREPQPESDLSVIGPMARAAEDLAMGLEVTAGPDRLTSAGIGYHLPAPPDALKGLRVAVWLDEACSPVDETVRRPIREAALALRAAGATVDFDARPAFDANAAHAVYEVLLHSQLGARRPDYATVAAQRDALDPADRSPAANFLRLSTASYKQIFDANNQRELLRWAWRDFFDRFDVLLAPITATAAFPHDHSEPMAARTMQVDGKPVPYGAQLFWAGLATCSYLPSTVAPVGLTPTGLPVGMQIMGAEMADRTTIWVARQLADLIGGFRPPPLAAK